MKLFFVVVATSFVLTATTSQAQQAVDLPKGWGNTTTGVFSFRHKCAACHGEWGGRTEAASTGVCFLDPVKLFFYVKNAMPPDAPGSLTDAEVYGLVAYILEGKKIIPRNTILNAQTLPKVVMPIVSVIPSSCPKAAGGLGKYESTHDGRKTMPAILPAPAPSAAPPTPAAKPAAKPRAAPR